MFHSPEPSCYFIQSVEATRVVAFALAIDLLVIFAPAVSPAALAFWTGLVTLAFASEEKAVVFIVAAT